jgi:predicted metalloprotease with PDZ domain
VIRYTLRFPAPHTHYVEVEAVYPTGGRAQIELFMPVWTPGSYLVREYARHVEAVVAKGADGRTHRVQKTRKNRWSVETGAEPALTVTYRVYGREMTVRNNWIESAFAMLNGAPTFVTLVDGLDQPHEVRIELAAGWTGIATPLTRAAGAANTFIADDFETLVDSPIVLGNPVVREFEMHGKRHSFVVEGDASILNLTQAVADVQKIVAAGNALMRRCDYPHYHFLNVITEASGGLEHKNSYLGMISRFVTRTRRAYLGWLGLLAHEYFHNWNGKRLRPIEFAVLDYESEVYSRALWIVEGFTEYYGSVLMRRAGLCTRDEFLAEISTMIEQVQIRPGRFVTSAAMASFDAWIKQYRPDENSPNSTIDYYAKGGVIAFLLDARIRAATGGSRSLDDAMRLGYERYANQQGYTIEQFYQVLSETAGCDLTQWLVRATETTEELDYSEALEWFGLRFRPIDSTQARAWLGAASRIEGGRIVISHVTRETPACDAGLNVDDEVLAIDDVRVRPDGLAARLEQYRPGDEIAMLVARRDRLVRLALTLGTDLGRNWQLEISPSASNVQNAQLTRWAG